MLEKSCRKTCGPFRLTGVKNPHTDVRKIVPYVHKRQKSQFLRERREYAEGPWHSTVGPAFPGGGSEKERAAQLPSNPTHPLGGRCLSGLQQPSVWQETDVVKGTSLQRLSYSVQTAGRPSCGKVCCLRKPPRKRGATGKGMLCQESLLHWR